MSGRRLDDSFLAEIARQYTEHVNAKRMPAPAIAATEGAPVRTVHRWVYEARKRGLLPEGTPPGLCGGATAPRALGAAGDAVRIGVRRMREARGLSVRDLAQRLKETDRPLIASQISKVETGLRRVDVDELAALAHALGVEMGVLLGTAEVCSTCAGSPPAGFECKECGAPEARVNGLRASWSFLPAGSTATHLGPGERLLAREDIQRLEGEES